jgi:hypothetical protein
MEVVEALRSAIRQRSGVTVMRIESVVDMADKTVRAMKPGAGSNKYPANKPIGTIVAVRSAVIGGIVEVSIRAHGSRPDVYADGNLSPPHRCTAEKGSRESRESKHSDFEHNSSMIRSEFQPGQLRASIILRIDTGQFGSYRGLNKAVTLGV